MERISHWIGGKVVPGESGRTGPVFNPATGEQTHEVDFATTEEMGAADRRRRRGLPRVARDIAVQARGHLLPDPRAARAAQA